MSEANFDFDGVLDAVLREEARVEPLRGLEARVMARVPAGIKPHPRKGIFWGPATAVAGLAVISVLVLGDFRERGIVTPEWKRSSLAGVLSAGAEKASQGRVPVSPRNAMVALRSGQRMRLRHANVAPTLRREVELQITPIAIVPLAVEPLEVTSLSMDHKEEVSQ